MKSNWLWLGAALFTLACNDTSGPPDGNPADTIPVNLTIIGRAEVRERITSEVAALGDWVYTGSWNCRGSICGDAVKVWNTAAATPVLVDSLIIPAAGTTGDVQISADGRLLVVANEYYPAGAISIFDRTNPAKPLLLTRFTTPDIGGGVHTVKLATVNNRDYAFLSINNNPASRSRLVIVDITNPRLPVQVFSAVMGQPTFIHDVFVRDGILFTALWDEGLTIWDIGGSGSGSPAAPRQMGNVKTVGGNVHNVFWFHDPSNGSKRYAFVGEEGGGSGTSSSGDIHVVDVSNLNTPSEVAFFHLDSAGVHNFGVDEGSGILYAAYYNGGVRALDIRGDLGNCTAEQRAPDGRCNLGLMKRERGKVLFPQPVSIWGVAIVGNVLYASDMLSGLWKIDITPLKR